ncbi:MAG: transposase [Zoogloeaceae bacterium]|nr:transposase [Zoogloeaceae bacterium]
MKQTPLEKLDRMIDWTALRTIVQEAVGERGQKATGRPAYSDDQLLRFTVLRLAHLCSANEACTALRVRLDWRMFCGFNLIEDVPDPSTVNRYWRVLEAADLLHPVLARVRAATIAQGFKLVPHRGRPAPYPVLRRGFDDGIWAIGDRETPPL